MNKKIALIAVIALVSTAMANAAQQDKKNDGKETTVAAARVDSASPADHKTASIPAGYDRCCLLDRTGGRAGHQRMERTGCEPRRAGAPRWTDIASSDQ